MYYSTQVVIIHGNEAYWFLFLLCRSGVNTSNIVYNSCCSGRDHNET